MDFALRLRARINHAPTFNTMERLPSRKKIRLSPSAYQKGHAFFITIATYDKHPWFLLYPDLCTSAIEVMRRLAPAQETTLYAWCFMPDHLHVLLTGSDVVEFIRRFKGTMTRKARAIEPGRRLWQRSFFDHALRKEESLVDVARYIWENPVRASMVKDPRDHSWTGSDAWPHWQEFYG